MMRVCPECEGRGSFCRRCNETGEIPARTLSDKQKAAMRAGRRRAAAERKRTRPDRIAEIEARVDRLGAEVDALRVAGEPIPWALRDELRAAGIERLDLRWAE